MYEPRTLGLVRTANTPVWYFPVMTTLSVNKKLLLTPPWAVHTAYFVSLSFYVNYIFDNILTKCRFPLALVLWTYDREVRLRTQTQKNCNL